MEGLLEGLEWSNVVVLQIYDQEDMSGKEKGGAEEGGTGQAICIGFAGKAKDGCGSHSQAHVVVRQLFRSASSLHPHSGNSCQHISTSVNITKIAPGLLTSTVSEGRETY